tara:strand:+ start:29 stop:559 length:531 start_codon:yes stop_codon:yes gene_type:complete
MRFLLNIFFLILVFINLSITDVFSHGPTRQKIKESVTIKAKPEDVWNVIKDFGKIDTWHPSISKVESDGKNRTIYYSPRNNTPIKQKLENFNPEKMMYKTSITEVDIKNFPVNTYTANISVKGNDDGTSTVMWKAAFYRAYVNNDPPPELNEAAAIKAVKEFFQAGLNNLKSKLEK